MSFRGNRWSSACALAVVAVVWLAMGLADWWFRFSWFSWQHRWIVQAQRATGMTGGSSAEKLIRYPARFGGDLTRLIGIPAVAHIYEQSRPASEQWRDRYGYRNHPAPDGTRYPVVVVGDSYMEDGITMDLSFPAQLAEVSGLKVYNHALAGWGSSHSVSRFLRAERFLEDPPAVLVWGLLEREVEDGYLEGLVYQVFTVRHEDAVKKTRTGFNKQMLKPPQLSASLLSSSALSQWAARLWNPLRYYAWDEINPYIIPVPERIGGRPVLFYFPAIDAMGWNESRRNIEKAAKAIAYLDEACRERNIRLVVVLIPDKEQVYREHIPARYLPLPPSCLIALEKSLDRKEIVAVNLLPAFRERAAAGELLYWGDDTHWNPEGIRLAAEVVWNRIAELVDTNTQTEL